jgi:hypothetical protein
MNRVLASLRYIALASRRCVVIAGLMISALAAPALSEASPMTWLLGGAVTSTFDNGLVPLGPITGLFTADPAANVWAGNTGCGGPHPEGGGYFFNALITINGQQYRYSGALEVNYDFTFCSPFSAGLIRIVPFTLSGPAQPPWFFGGQDQGNQSGAYIAGFPADRFSPAFPSSSSLSLLLRFGFNQSENVRISVSLGNVVPEPATLLLLCAGLAAAAAGRRFRALRQLIRPSRVC